MEKTQHYTTHSQAHQMNFRVEKRIPFGRALYVCGNIPELGSWIPQNSLRLGWNQDDVWTGSAAISQPITGKIQFKYTVNSATCPSNWEVQWQVGIHNRKICLEQSTQNTKYNDKWNMNRICLYLLASQSTEKQRDYYVIGETGELGNWKKPQLMQRSLPEKLSILYKQILPKQEKFPETMEIYYYSFYFSREKEELHYCYLHEGETYQHQKQLERTLKLNEEGSYQHFRKRVYYTENKIGVVDECDTNQLVFAKKPNLPLVQFKQNKRETKKTRERLSKQQKQIQNRFLRLIKPDEYKPESITRISKLLTKLTQVNIKNEQQITTKIQQSIKQMIMQKLSHPLLIEQQKKKIETKIRNVPQIQKEVKQIQIQIQTITHKCPNVTKQIKSSVESIQLKKKEIIKKNKVEIKQGNQKNQILVYCQNLDYERIEKNINCSFNHQNSFNVSFERLEQRAETEGMIEARLCIKVNFDQLFHQLLIQSKNIQHILVINSIVKNEFAQILTVFIKGLEEQSNEMRQLSQQLKDSVNQQHPYPFHKRSQKIVNPQNLLKNSLTAPSESAQQLEQRMITTKNKSKLLQEVVQMAESLVERAKQEAINVIEVSQKIQEIEEIEENRQQLKQYFVKMQKRETQYNKGTPLTTSPMTKPTDKSSVLKAKVELSQKVKEKIKTIGKKPNALKETKELISPDLKWWRSQGLSDKLIVDDLMRICELDEQTAKGLINA